MSRKLRRYLPPAILTLIASGIGLYKYNSPAALEPSEFMDLYTLPAQVTPGKQNVFHLGHSLVGRDMPSMLAQLAGKGHTYDSQLGWGTPIKAHWDPDVEINGFDVENDHPRYRDAHEAVSSGEYDSLTITEMVEIRDAIKYFDSGDYLHRWAQVGWKNNPDMRVYLYETWHELDDEEGWLDRLALDLGRYWEKEILRRALAYEDMPYPIYVIPAGQVMKRFSQEVSARGGIGPITSPDDLFSDQIHFNDYGAYLVALTHYAVLYQRSPIGLPHALLRADGTFAKDPGPEAARVMQETVWDVVTHYPPTGVPQ